MLKQGRNPLEGLSEARRILYMRVLRAFSMSFQRCFGTPKSTLRNRGAILVIAALLVPLSVLLGVLTSTSANAATSSYLNFQGRLLGSSGNLVADGTYNIQFNLYTVSSGGSTEWTETYLNTGTPVTIKNGYFSVQLGSLTSFPSTINWDQEHWLGMTVRGTGSCVFGSCTPADAEMTPRFQLTSVPFAKQAGTALGVTSNATATASTDSGNVVIQSGNATGATSNSGNITIDTGTATTTTGTISIGATSASSLILGRAGLTTLNNGSLTVAQNLTVQGGTGTFGTTIQAGSLIVSDGSSSTITLKTATQVAATNYDITIPVITGNDTFCLVTAANCAGLATTTLQQAYDNDANGSNAIIALTVTDGAVVIRDAASTVGDLFVVEDNGGTDYLTVTANGITLSGTNSQLIFSGVTTDITTASNQDLTIDVNGTGVIKLQDEVNAYGRFYIEQTAASYVQIYDYVGGGGADISVQIRSDAAEALRVISSAAATVFNVDASSGNGIVSNFGDMIIGDAASDLLTINAILQGTNALVFEGSGADANETTFAITNPTADQTITFPDATGTITLATSGSSIVGVSAFLQGGNTWAGTATLGTNDSNSLILETNNTTALTINNAQAATFSGALAVNGNTTLGDTTGDTITFTGRVNSDILPSVNDTYNLGSDSLRWANLYLGGETIHLGTSTSDEAAISYVTATDSLVIKNATDSTTALQVQRNTGSTPVLTVDTTNSKTIFRGTNSDATQGSELITSNAFNNATYWTVGSGWSGGASSATATTASGTVVATSSNVTISTGVTYQVRFTITGYSAGTVGVSFGAAGAAGISGNGANITVTGTTSSTAALTFTGAGFTGVISAVSVKVITPNNATIELQDESGVNTLEFRTGTAAMSSIYLGLNAGRLSDANSFNNTALGNTALELNTSGNDNVAIGNSALNRNTTGLENVAVGSGALATNVTGVDNVALGFGAMSANITGNSNVSLGYSAGAAITSGSNNILIGASADVLTGSTSNFLNIGDSLYGDLSNDRIAIGTSTTTAARLTVTNASSSDSILELQDNTTSVLTIANGGSVLFANETNSSTAFRIQNATSADTLFNVDTTARSGSGGNLIKIGNSTGTDGNTTILQLDGATANPTTNLSALNGGLFYNSTTNKVSIIENGTVKIVCNQTDALCGGNSTTLQQAYDADADGSDVTIALTSTDGSLIISNPSSGGSTSGYVATLNQQATGAVGGLDIQSAGTGNLLRIRDTTATATDVVAVANGGATTFRNQTDSTNAFQIQNAAGTTLVNFGTSGTAQNLLPNSSFESGNYNGWRVRRAASGLAVSNAQFLYGTNSLAFDTNTAAYNGIDFEYPLKASTQYSLSLWMRRSASTTSTINIGIAHTSYITGSASTSGSSTTVTGSGTTWTAAMVGSKIYFGSGTSRIITARASNTSITVDTAINIPAGTLYEIATITDCLTGQTVNTTWTNYTCTFTTGTNPYYGTAIYIMQSDTTTDTIYLDGVTLVTGATALPFASISTGSILQVENIGAGVVTLFGGSANAELGPWKSSPFDQNFYYGNGVVTVNGYMYSLGGTWIIDDNGYSEVFYTKLNADGTNGAWTSTTSLPYGATNATYVAHGNYIYMLGGRDDAGFTDHADVYYAKVNNDGTLGSWVATTSMPLALHGHVSVVAKGYVYVIAGREAADSTTAYYAKLNADGTVGAWTSTTPLSGSALRYDAGVVYTNGYIYVTGGQSISLSTSYKTVFYAPVNDNGTIGTWTQDEDLPVATSLRGHAMAAANGYIYTVGGYVNDTADTDQIYYARQNSDGSVGTWTAATNSLPDAWSGQWVATANSTMYVVAGYQVFSARMGGVLQVGGSIDLVGIQGQNLADGSGTYTGNSGGSITAGNITAVGSLEVLGTANIAQNVNIGGGLSVQGNSAINGNLTIGAQTSATTAATITHVTAGTLGSQTARDGISSQAVYNGKLYVATSEANASSIFRYDIVNGSVTSGYTLVTSSTAGRVIAGDATNIDSMVLAVYNGRLYAGTRTGTATNTGAVYVYDGTTWTLVNATRGTFGAETNVDGVDDFAVYDGRLYILTGEPDGAALYRFDGGSTMSNKLNATAGKGLAEAGTDIKGGRLIQYNSELWWGAITSGNTARIYKYNGNTFILMTPTAGTIAGVANVDEITSMAVYNGQLYVGVAEPNLAFIAAYKGGDTTPATPGDDWIKTTDATSGKVVSGDTANIDSITALRPYNGRLYAATDTGSATNTGALYEFSGLAANGTSNGWSLINATRGTFGSQTNVDKLASLQVFNGSLYLGTEESNGGSVYAFTKTLDNSYALNFSGSTTNPQSAGSISFVATQQAIGNATASGTFLFTNGITTSAGAYDVAEDYPTRDASLVEGNIVILDTSEKGFVKKSDGTKYDNRAVGVYSTTPALRLSQVDATIDGARAVPVALAGRVPVKVTNENGPIVPGDYITTSSRAGFGMKATGGGQVIGKALEGFDGAEGSVLVFVNITQNGMSTEEMLVNTSFTDLEVTGTLTVANVKVEKVEVSGDLVVNGSSILQFVRVRNDLEIGGKIISVGNTPDVKIEHDTQLPFDAETTVYGTDVTGLIKLVTNNANQNTMRIKIKFNKQYTTIPSVVIAPLGRDSAVLGAFIETVTKDEVIVNFLTVPDLNKTYQFNYQILQAKPTVAGAQTPQY